MAQYQDVNRFLIFHDRALPVKTRVQLSKGNAGAFKTGQMIVQNEGVLALYKGLTPFVVHLVSKYALRFYMNEFYRGILADENGKVSRAGGFGAGLGAGVTEAILIVTPFEVVKTRLQQQKGMDKLKLKYQNPVHCAQTIIKEEGVRALWKGCTPTMVRQGLNQCFLFGCYDIIKQGLWNVERNESISARQALLTGMVAGMIGPFVNCPVDVCKTRLMSQTNTHTGMIDCISTIYKEEGFLSLYKGIFPRVARVAPGQGITFMVMESVCNLLAD